MYAQWRSMAEYEAMRADPRPRSYLEEALRIATFDPGSYEVVEESLPRPKSRISAGTSLPQRTVGPLVRTHTIDPPGLYPAPLG